MIDGLLALALVASDAPAVRAELEPFAFLVGSCWTGAFKDGSTDTHCFEPVYGGAFVRDRHVVRGAKQPYEGETIHAWDARQKRLVFTYWASDGSLTTGVAEPKPSGEIVFPQEHESAAGRRVLRSVWTPSGPDSYDVVVAEQKDGAWRELWRMAMKREAAK